MTTVLEPTTTRFAAIDDFSPLLKTKRAYNDMGVSIAKSGAVAIPVAFIRNPARIAVDYSAANRTLRLRPANEDDVHTYKLTTANTTTLRGVLQALGLYGKRLHWRTRYIENGCLYLPLDEVEVS